MTSFRKIVPRTAISAARFLQVFLRGHAHDRTIDGIPVDANGNSIPWLTYPMIEFLDGLDTSTKSVFEYGAGGSTLYWARRAASVVSVELDGAWANRIKSVAPPNVEVIHEPDGHAYAAKATSLGRLFDIIVIDGAERYRSTMSALATLAPGGMIILDNAEWYPNSAALLASSGLIEVPMNGFPPINAFPSTSTLFLSRDFNFQRNVRKPPIGGRTLPGGALDDAAPVSPP